MIRQRNVSASTRRREPVLHGAPPVRRAAVVLTALQAGRVGVSLLEAITANRHSCGGRWLNQRPRLSRWSSEPPAGEGSRRPPQSSSSLERDSCCSSGVFARPRPTPNGPRTLRILKVSDIRAPSSGNSLGGSATPSLILLPFRGFVLRHAPRVSHLPPNRPVPWRHLPFRQALGSSDKRCPSTARARTGFARLGVLS